MCTLHDFRYWGGTLLHCIKHKNLLMSILHSNFMRVERLSFFHLLSWTRSVFFVLYFSLFSNLTELDKVDYLIDNFFGPASARSCKIGVVGNNWLVDWLVGNAVFSKAGLRIFLIFYTKLGDYKGRKVTEPDFWKNS